VRKKTIKRELRGLSERYAQLELAHRRLAAHLEVIALAVRSPDRVPRAARTPDRDRHNRRRLHYGRSTGRHRG
jgi:hypothetical protein